MEKAVLEVKVRYRKKFSKNAMKLVLKHALFEKDFVYRVFDTFGDFLRSKTRIIRKRFCISNFRHFRGFFRSRATKFCQLCVYWIGSRLLSRFAL
jgi:hypothetical protein